MPIWKRIKSLLSTRSVRDRHEQAAQIQQAYAEEQRHIVALTFAEYRSLLSTLLLPAMPQTSEFAEFVSTAHSWCKRLPPNLPGRDKLT